MQNKTLKGVYDFTFH